MWMMQWQPYDHKDCNKNAIFRGTRFVDLCKQILNVNGWKQWQISMNFIIGFFVLYDLYSSSYADKCLELQYFLTLYELANIDLTERNELVCKF